MPELNTVTDPNLPEPKGVASASAGMVYIADGAGSGTWTYWPTGWGYYQDAGAAQVFNTTASKLSIDGAGSLTNEDALPREIRGSASLWDTTNDKILPINYLDKYDLRLDLPITAETGSPTELTLQFDIGNSATPTIVIVSRYVPTGKATPYTMSIGMPLVGLTPLTVTNGIQIFAKTDFGTVTITNPSITIGRDHNGDF